ncbi:MAG: hypothetical protein O7F16_10515 [Acidobacteria bacterium]|nr:hypothetical protein [Acidobacteriota bacterium]
MEDPKKRLSQHDILHRLYRDDLRRRMMDVASSLTNDTAVPSLDEEPPVPSWIEPRDLIRILAPYVCLN